MKQKNPFVFFCGVPLPGVVGENTNNGGTGAVFVRGLSFVVDNTYNGGGDDAVGTAGQTAP